MLLKELFAVTEALDDPLAKQFADWLKGKPGISDVSATAFKVHFLYNRREFIASDSGSDWYLSMRGKRGVIHYPHGLPDFSDIEHAYKTSEEWGEKRVTESKEPKFKKGDKVKCNIEPVQGTPNGHGPQKEWLDGVIVGLSDVKHHNPIWMVKFNAEDAKIVCDTYAIDDEDGDHTFGWTEDDIKKV